MNYLKMLLTLTLFVLTITSNAADNSMKNPILGHGTYGNGAEKVIVLHDWMGDAANYEPVIPYLDANTFTTRNLATSTKEAMQGYYKMWLETDFSEDARKAKIKTPIRVIGGRQDLPGFQEAKYKTTFMVWYPKAEIKYVTDAGNTCAIGNVDAGIPISS